jgi:hypothetical protein
VIGPRMELVAGRRAERTEWGLRSVRDGWQHKKGHVEQRDSLEYALTCRERPYAGRAGDEQVVSRTIVTYTTDWKQVPGYEGSVHLSCSHTGTPQGRLTGSVFAPKGPDYQPPHGFRERDMTVAEDGRLEYRCPVCGLVWRHREDTATPQGLLF